MDGVDQILIRIQSWIMIWSILDQLILSRPDQLIWPISDQFIWLISDPNPDMILAYYLGPSLTGSIILRHGLTGHLYYKFNIMCFDASNLALFVCSVYWLIDVSLLRLDSALSFTNPWVYYVVFATADLILSNIILEKRTYLLLQQLRVFFQGHLYINRYVFCWLYLLSSLHSLLRINNFYCLLGIYSTISLVILWCYVVSNTPSHRIPLCL